MKTAIVGTRFRPGGIQALAKLQKGAPLRIIRERQNPHDQNAVAVYSWDNEHLGYVPRSANGDLARDLDGGGEFFAVLTDEAIVSAGEVKFAAKIAITRRAPR